jgi:hypothetical protein
MYDLCTFEEIEDKVFRHCPISLAICQAYDLSCRLVSSSVYSVVPLSVLCLPLHFFLNFTTRRTQNIDTSHFSPSPYPPTAQLVQIESENSFIAQKTKEAEN